MKPFEEVFGELFKNLITKRNFAAAVFLLCTFIIFGPIWMAAILMLWAGNELTK